MVQPDERRRYLLRPFLNLLRLVLYYPFVCCLLSHSHFFLISLPIANRLREECAQYVLGLMINDLTTSSVEVAVFDATNTTHARRALIQERCRDVRSVLCSLFLLGFSWYASYVDVALQAGIETMFVESICNDLEIIASNIRETKLRSPDYVRAGIASSVCSFFCPPPQKNILLIFVVRCCLCVWPVCVPLNACYLPQSMRVTIYF